MYLILIFSFFFSSKTFCQEISLSERNTLWKTVTGGQAVCPPVKTTEGFAILHDGNKLTGFSENGKILFEKNVRLPEQNRILESSKHGFLFYIDKDNNFYIVSPYGKTIYKKHTEQPPKQIIPATDGRFYVLYENKTECYGANGICKWVLEESFKNAAALSDSSLLSLQKKFAIRISPYGKKTVINFSAENTGAEPVKACSSDSSIFILFTDRTIKTYSLADFSEKAVLNVSAQIIPEIKNDCIFKAADDSTLTFCDGKSAVSFSPVNGKIKRKILFDLASLNNSQIFTDSNYFVFSCKNWETVCYKLFPFHKNLIQETKTKAVQGNLSGESLEYYRQLLLKGYYGEKERDLIQAVYEILQTYYEFLTSPVKNTKNVPPDYVTDTSFLKDIILLSGYFGSDYFCSITAKLLKAEGKYELITALLNSAANTGMDINGQILNSIEDIIMRSSIQGNLEIVNSICDALFNISRNMGDSYSKKAAAILIKIITGSAGIQQKKSAQKTMIKIGSLKAD